MHIVGFTTEIVSADLLIFDIVGKHQLFKSELSKFKQQLGCIMPYLHSRGLDYKLIHFVQYPDANIHP